MFKKLFTTGLACLMILFVMTGTYVADAQEPIRGPWLWMIAPTEPGRGGAKSTDIDSLAIASGGTVTEADVAVNSANIGAGVGDYAWTLGELPENGDIEKMLLDIGMVTRNVRLDDFSSYALITLESATAQSRVTMGVSSDDSIKVWLNGEVVHTNAVNRGKGGRPRNIDDFQDKFQVNLNAGDNLLLVKVGERSGGWGMYVGVDANVNAVYKPPTPPVSGRLIFSPTVIADQTFTVGTPVSLTLPIATGGTPPYIYSLTSTLPAGLYFDPIAGGPGYIGGTPTAALPPTPFTYTATDAMGASVSLTFTITVQDTPPPTGVYMYWTDGHACKIQRANLDGSNVVDLVLQVCGNYIAVDVAGGKMYWTASSSSFNGIRRANLNGSNVENLVTQDRDTAPTVSGIALDVAGGKMYWMDGRKIRRANLNGTNVQDLILLSEDRGHWSDIELDLIRRKLYWTEGKQIYRSNLDGSNKVLIYDQFGDVFTIALDVAGGKIYYSGINDHQGIHYFDIDALPVSHVVDIQTLVRHDGASDMVLDLAGGKMYWVGNANYSDGRQRGVHSVNLDGTNQRVVVTAGRAEVRNPGSIALGIPQVQSDDGLRFTPSEVANQTFTVGTPVSLTLPSATGGTSPYTYTLSPIPAGLQFDPTTQLLSGTPTTATPATLATYTATDAAGASASLNFSIGVIEDAPGPGTDPLDVNGDGKVTVVDLAIVALFYGTRVPVGISLPADVNADGIVDLADLTAVAQAIDAAGGVNGLSVKEVELALLIAAEQAVELEAAAGAPGRVVASVSVRLAAKNVSDALAAVRTDVWNPQKGFAVLETFLALLTEMTMTPDTTALLANYPNPFNPETWIPYQLASSSDVQIVIYDTRGATIRHLALGHQPAGNYITRDRAAYWDGRNGLGERVAAGVYFYRLQADNLSFLRKMVIVK